MRRLMLILTVLSLVGVALALAYRGHSLSREAERAEQASVPLGLTQNRPAAQQPAIERAYRHCLGQAVLDGLTVNQAAPTCEQRLARSLPH